MNTAEPSKTRIRVTPLRRLRGDTYVPREAREIPLKGQVVGQTPVPWSPVSSPSR
ncbi:hypothetical protein ACQEWB_03855 [Streptomyces sp. CA-249302]|uniref:hypothetical protein n=1 Tax=Streptomyces sp. CA-249302 TaxID=3240058 RepID=UPI003D94D2A6